MGDNINMKRDFRRKEAEITEGKEVIKKIKEYHFHKMKKDLTLQNKNTP